MAVRLGRVNVDAMLRSLTAKQYAAWEHYAQLEPFDEERADYRAASIVQTLANINRPAKSKPYKLVDFLLQFEGSPKREKPKQTWAEQEAIFKLLAAGFRAEAEAKK